MRIARGRAHGAGSEERGPAFTGRVWADPVLSAEGDVGVNSVFFEPGARTHWHTHAIGQVLYVTHGEGYVVTRDGVGGRISAGDVVHVAAGEEHWHGASPTAYLLHLAISLGPATWLDPVEEADYQAAFAGSDS
ncbi:MAG TPA: cupin domain-containing protein [Gaiellaceae bacterium]|nr:cupin domain-containing protein [Gaiellaceae bacterium]